jgi:hypothetical protein
LRCRNDGRFRRGRGAFPTDANEVRFVAAHPAMASP